MTGTLTLTEDDHFYFDAEAADRPVRFIEKYCCHYEGKFAGQPFELHPAQRNIVRDLFGWKWRKDGRRRFTDCYLEGAIGSGKSPLLAAIGLYGLMADKEAGAQVYSLASNYGQARVVFEAAKKFVGSNVELDRRLVAQQYVIKHPSSHSTWRIVSGKGPGAGCRPSMILADEAHQWPNAGAYKDLRDRMSKRRQPLMIVATNAGESRASFCWHLREKAVAALAGTGEQTLYPVIWAADDDAETMDPVAWEAANPLIGVTIEADKIRRICREAMGDPIEEADKRRLYLGIWPKTTGGRWLDLAQWDACAIDGPPPADAPLYVGLDLSQGDDLCAAAWVYLVSERPKSAIEGVARAMGLAENPPGAMYIDAHFWIPRETAERYEQKQSIPYLKWAEAGCVTIVPEPTIGSEVRKRIAARVIEQGKGRTIKAVCYDPYAADETIAALEAANLTCVPVRQGYSVSPGCFELERRLKERSAILSTNFVLRFCAENCQVKQDDRGNIWPVKPNARGKYAGKRGAKIDGITALVTALTEARKHSFPAARKMFNGAICRI